MKWIKLTALFVIVLPLFASLSSCERDADKKKILEYSKLNVLLTGAQVTPASASAALGSMDLIYRRDTRTLSYTVKWSGLSAPPNAINIRGQAIAGFSTSTIAQTIITAANPTLYPASGSYTGFIFCDGSNLKEADLLNGFYYLNIQTPLYPNGEIRGQIRFQ